MLLNEYKSTETKQLTMPDHGVRIYKSREFGMNKFSHNSYEF